MPQFPQEVGLARVADTLMATCPLCHTAEAGMSSAALREGASWRCVRCGQRWDATRLQTAADYARHEGRS
jgi:transposase-like protein